MLLIPHEVLEDTFPLVQDRVKFGRIEEGHHSQSKSAVVTIGAVGRSDDVDSTSTVSPGTGGVPDADDRPVAELFPDAVV